MRTFRMFSILLLVVGMNPFHMSFSQEQTKERVYHLRVESIDPNNPHIRFSSAYASLKAKDSTPLVVGEQETPFETKLSGSYFLGMFKDISGKMNIKVSLVVRFTNGEKSCEAEGSGDLNILHADPAGVGYGWPTTLGDISNLQHSFDTHESKEK